MKNFTVGTLIIIVAMLGTFLAATALFAALVWLVGATEWYA